MENKALQDILVRLGKDVDEFRVHLKKIEADKASLDLMAKNKASLLEEIATLRLKKSELAKSIEEEKALILLGYSEREKFIEQRENKLKKSENDLLEKIAKLDAKQSALDILTARTNERESAAKAAEALYNDKIEKIRKI